MDKDTVMIEYLNTCPSISDKSLFFNYAEGEDDTNHFVTQATDVSRQQPYIDGSVEKRYSFSIYAYKSLGYRAVDVDNAQSDENLGELVEVQAIIDWINQQGEDKNFPDFGEDCQIDEMKCTTDKPVLMGTFQDNVGTPIARYSMTIQIDYLDTTKLVWK